MEVWNRTLMTAPLNWQLCWLGRFGKRWSFYSTLSNCFVSFSSPWQKPNYSWQMLSRAEEDRVKWAMIRGLVKITVWRSSLKKRRMGASQRKIQMIRSSIKVKKKHLIMISLDADIWIISREFLEMEYLSNKVNICFIWATYWSVKIYLNIIKAVLSGCLKNNTWLGAKVKWIVSVHNSGPRKAREGTQKRTKLN